jgi:serine/threonine protein phosphatase PrpC
MKLVFSGLSDVGQKRDHNEDSFLIDQGLNLFVVADGMGGHAGGGTASRIAVKTIDNELRQIRDRKEANPFQSNLPPSDLDNPLPEFLRSTVETACRSIYRTAQEDPRLSGMGTTVTALLIHSKNEYAYIAHVGDSRAYLVRGEAVKQISEDHSLVNEQIKAGMISKEEAKLSRYKNIITRSVGFEEEVMVDVMGLKIEPGDVFVLCSDGLANFAEDREIHEIISGGAPSDAAKKFIDLANSRGGDDNITVVVVQVTR